MILFSNKKKDQIENEKKKTPAEGELKTTEIKTALPLVDDAGAYQAVLGPHMTEKASLLGGLNKYVFKVSWGSNKLAIRDAIEKLYKVKVRKVAVQSMPAKERKLGRQVGYRPGFKKAVVTLAEGYKIDVAV